MTACAGFTKSSPNSIERARRPRYGSGSKLATDKFRYRCKFLLTCGGQAIFMKILIGGAAGWIAFYAVDLSLFNGRLMAGIPQLATAILNGFGFYF